MVSHHNQLQNPIVIRRRCCHTFGGIGRVLFIMTCFQVDRQSIPNGTVNYLKKAALKKHPELRRNVVFHMDDAVPHVALEINQKL